MLPRFYPIVDTTVVAKTKFSAVELAQALIETGATILQYRHKERWTQQQFDEAKTVAGICQQVKAQFVVNDRADFAHLLGAGLHIGQDDLPVSAARTVVGNAPIGYSTHNPSQLRQSIELAVDYVSLGPIFATTSKENPDPVIGLEGLIKLRPVCSKPLVAIGGITLLNALDVLTAGVDSVAVISALIPAEQSYAQLRHHLSQWTQL